MWPKFCNSKLFTVLVSSVVSVLLFIAAQRATIRQTDANTLDLRLAKKADISLVYAKDSILQMQINTGKENCKEVKDNLDVYVKETNENLREIRNYIMGKK
jgi:hypothetical protein